MITNQNKIALLLIPTTWVSEKKCPYGYPLQTENNMEWRCDQFGEGCPGGWTCNFHPADAHYCCPGEDSVTVTMTNSLFSKIYTMNSVKYSHRHHKKTTKYYKHNLRIITVTIAELDWVLSTLILSPYSLTILILLYIICLHIH